jgi:hypothetical protein
VGAKTSKHGGRGFDAAVEGKWFGQLVKISLRWLEIAQGAQAVERAAFRRRRENRHPAPSIRDLDRFALFDATQELAGPLPELSDTNGRHVLLIAQ